jgi:Ca2+-binding RTX toxin-like protein
VSPVVDVADDSATIDDTVGKIAVLANDTFEGRPAITAVGAAAHAAVTVDDNGTPGDTADDFVVYTPTANFHGSDSFTYTVTSGAVTETATVNVTVSPVNDPVTSSAPATLLVSEDSSVAVTGLAITDVDTTLTPGGQYLVALAATQGTLSLSTLAGLAFFAGDGTADANMTFTGTLAAINSALATASYAPNANYNGAAAISITVTDQAGGVIATGAGAATIDSDSISVTVNPANDPVTSTAPATAVLDEDTTVAITGLSIADIDTVLTPSGQYAVTLSATHGAVTLSSIAGLAFIAGDGTADASMTFSGTLAAINTALGTASYTPDANYNGSAQVTIAVTDQAGGVVATGSGAATSDSDTVNLTINALPDAPTDITGGPLAVNEDSISGTLVGTLTGQDPENQTLAYTLTDDAGGRFAINNAGQITVANGVLLDFEQNAFHAIGVRATDTDGLFLDKSFVVAVNDLNPELAIGDDGANTLVGGSGDDTINGNAGDDLLVGGGGNDYITSLDGNDQAYGQAGNDTVIGGNGDDYLNGGADDDLIIGNDGADTLLGDTGNDYLDGGAGDDLVMGGAGNDTVLGADGNDYVNGGDGDDRVFGGDGVDTLLGADGNDYLNGENGDDIVFGDGGNDTVIGGEGNDYLSAGAGDDNLVGGNGNDTLFAGSGSDYLQGDSGDDFFIFDATFETSIIIDFEPGTVAHHDVIQFNGGVFTDFADMMSHAVQSATNTVITDAGGHTLTLANVAKANLISDDFVFVV